MVTIMKTKLSYLTNWELKYENNKKYFFTEQQKVLEQH